MKHPAQPDDDILVDMSKHKQRVSVISGTGGMYSVPVEGDSWFASVLLSLARLFFVAKQTTTKNEKFNSALIALRIS